MYIEIIIDEELEGTPLAGQSGQFVRYGAESRVDPLLLVAISHHESKHCKAYAAWYNRKYYNCAGIMDGGQANGLVAYTDYEGFIKDFAELLGDYIYKHGRDTVGKIGSRYAPVNSHILNYSWNGAVSKKYKELWKELK